MAIEPYHRSLEAGRRIADLSRELGVPKVAAVANKIRTEEDRGVVGDFCEAHELPVLAWVPFDESLIRAEREGRPPIDHDAGAPAVAEIRRLAGSLLEDRAGRA